MRIIFLGTPEFAVDSLRILVENGYNVVVVITACDKPAGRGQKLTTSAVKDYAVSKGLNVLQPVKMNDPQFLEEVKKLNADLQIVVAFRMMPEALWSMPPLGTFNLHASLLPQYRGAAPINRAIMNGEKVTGLTTFFLKHEIDTGNIIFRKEIPIGENENAGELHDRMKVVGADLVLQTVKAIENDQVVEQSQQSFLDAGEKIIEAPKIYKEDGRLDFSKSIQVLHNQIRGLSPFPGAYFDMKMPEEQVISIKILKASPEPAGTVLTHELITDGKKMLKISASDGFINVLEIQVPGKKRMKTHELLSGFSFPEDAVIL
ncbi:MAG: methionyl-tRNA formyltransferase [Bacteroidetes bacterium]|nr:methionyl-tRNA formyltransferase [Bacteroidota bacterium]